MKTYGLIGYPVKHSLSPAMHNAAFKRCGIEAEYKLFEVEPERLREFFSHFRESLSGINVTIPHKEATLEYVDNRSEAVEEIGALNTVVLENDVLVGHNTDVTGFIGALVDDLGFEAAGAKRAVIFGAGGASRAVAAGLKRLEIKEIFLTDIDGEKAAVLAEGLIKQGLAAAAIEFDKRALGELVYSADLVVNATPCGMKAGDPPLFDPKYLKKETSVFDLIYNPAETPLIRDARKVGCSASNGLGMLLYQGAEAFELWTGEKAPVDIMKEALLKALGRS